MFPPARSRRKVDKSFNPPPGPRDKPPRSNASTKKQGGSTKKKNGQHAKSKQSKPPAASSTTVQPKKKIVGVRRILSREGDEEDLITDQSYQHGLENPIIASLISCNPKLLGRVLCVRDAMAATRSDYILSLLASRGENDVRRDNSTRKRSAAVAALSASSIQLNSGNTRPSKRKADKILGSLGVDDTDGLRKDIEAAVNQQGETGRESLLIGDDGEDAFAIISREESLFLQDVLEEIQLVQAKRKAGTIPASTCRSTSTSIIDESSSCVDRNDPSSNVDDLKWLTQEMEKEFKLFLKHSQQEKEAGATESDSGKAGKAKYRFKAFLTLTRGGNCNLGTYRTADEAALAYDRGALARRTLGRLVQEELTIRRAVKVRKAAYLETKRALEYDHVTPEVAAKRAYAAAMEAFQAVKSDAYLSSSDKVARPDLNTVENASDFFDSAEDDEDEVEIDHEGIALARANKDEVDRISSAMLDGGKAGVALDMCMKELEDSEEEKSDAPAEELGKKGDAPTHEDSLTAKINELNAEYKSLTESLASRGNEIARLIKLEESMVPLLREEDYCSAQLTSSFLEARAKDMGEPGP